MCDSGSSRAACQHAAKDVAFQHAQTLGRIQQIQNFGAHVVHRPEATPGRFTLTTFLGTLQDTTSANTPYTHPATLDTGRVVSAYPGGIPTRLSSDHFQSARSSVC